MKKKGIMALSTFLWLSGNPSFAHERGQALPGEPWTLDRCIEYALENNIDIKRKELYEKQRKWRSVKEGGLILPVFTSG